LGARRYAAKTGESVDRGAGWLLRLSSWGTIYLVDLVGSTRLATAVGPVRWDEMREQFFGLLGEVIDASGAGSSRTRAMG
jgi:class 3 adenylate cyclase